MRVCVSTPPTIRQKYEVNPGGGEVLMCGSPWLDLLRRPWRNESKRRYSEHGKRPQFFAFHSVNSSSINLLSHCKPAESIHFSPCTRAGE
jgi:hypothetical protein